MNLRHTLLSMAIAASTPALLACDLEGEPGYERPSADDSETAAQMTLTLTAPAIADAQVLNLSISSIAFATATNSGGAAKGHDGRDPKFSVHADPSVAHVDTALRSVPIEDDEAENPNDPNDPGDTPPSKASGEEWINFTDTMTHVSAHAGAATAIVLGLGDVPAGSYGKIRLRVSAATVLEGGVERPVQLRDGDPAVSVTIEHRFVVQAGHNATIALALDQSSLTRTAEGEFILNPRLQATTS